MDKFNLYGRLLANAALLDEPQKDSELIYKRLDTCKDYIYLKTKKFLALACENKALIENINVLNRPISQLEFNKINHFAIIHNIVNP